MKKSLMTTSMVIPLIRQLQSGVPMEQILENYENILKTAADCGFSYVEITSMELEIFGVENIRKALARAGLRCSCLIHMDTFAETDLQKQERIRTSAVEKLHAAKELGTEYIMLALMAQPDAGSHSAEELREALVRTIRPVAVCGKEMGVTVSVEDTPEISLPLSSSEEMRALLDQIPELFLTYDTGNMLIRGEDPLHFYDALKDRIVYVHLKDMEYCEKNEGDLTADGRSVKAVLHGRGMIDFKSVLKALKENGYDGILMLEYAGTDNHAENISAAVRYIDQIWKGV